MSNELQIFNFGSKKIQEITDEKNVNWFVASDICEALGIKDVSQALERIDEEDQNIIKIQTNGGLQSVTIVNEFGLAALTLSSRKEKAQSFKRWFSHDCIQAIKNVGKTKEASLLYGEDEIELVKEYFETTEIPAITARIENRYCPSEEKAFYAEKEEKIRQNNMILAAIYKNKAGNRHLSLDRLLDICHNLDMKEIKETINRLLEKEIIDKKIIDGEPEYFMYNDEFTRLTLSGNTKQIGSDGINGQATGPDAK
jgi:prophage antirepressor-like protein